MNFYERLGLGANATEEDIKRAYRKLARRFHPDTGAPADVERFHAIQEAYETLSDPERRSAYDRAGSLAAVPVSWGGGFEEPIPSWSAFREVTPSMRAEPPVHVEIVLSPEEARRGGDVTLEVPQQVVCPGCGGRGRDFFGWCRSCAGKGAVRLYERFRFRVPPGVANGETTSAHGSDGKLVRARVRVVA